ncbi:MAG: hypothetical protein EOO51_00415 [Flavobacterium sp.]|nr:MAG: hypothetical protein EOO51_00415 [Flavobacterium sp.]
MSDTYQDIYIKRDGEFVSLKKDVEDFCEKYIKPVHPEHWNWAKRDFEDPANEPTIAEARAIRNVIYQDLTGDEPAIDLSTIDNVEAIKAYLNPQSVHEQFNMEEFAYALKVELEHGKLKAVNVTNNHPFLTAMIALAHMTESLTYYKRLQIMEAEGEMYELLRKIEAAPNDKQELQKELVETVGKLTEYRKQLDERLNRMDDIPVLEKIGD